MSEGESGEPSGIIFLLSSWWLPWWLRGWRIHLLCRRPSFNPPDTLWQFLSRVNVSLLMSSFAFCYWKVRAMFIFAFSLFSWLLGRLKGEAVFFDDFSWSETFVYPSLFISYIGSLLFMQASSNSLRLLSYHSTNKSIIFNFWKKCLVLH